MVVNCVLWGSSPARSQPTPREVASARRFGFSNFRSLGSTRTTQKSRHVACGLPTKNSRRTAPDPTRGGLHIQKKTKSSLRAWATRRQKSGRPDPNLWRGDPPTPALGAASAVAGTRQEAHTAAPRKLMARALARQLSRHISLIILRNSPLYDAGSVPTPFSGPLSLSRSLSIPL